jgi:hypothetical protein
VISPPNLSPDRRRRYSHRYRLRPGIDGNALGEKLAVALVGGPDTLNETEPG